MEIVLIRHGEPEWVLDGLNVDNPPLTTRGHRQAEAMAEYLRGEEFDEVFCSPLVRARQTAAPLFAAMGRHETIDPWLEEIRNPIWHGTPQEKADEAYRQDRARPAEQRWLGLTGGEPVSDFVERIRLGATLFLSERSVVRTEQTLPVWKIGDPDRRIALVAHAGTNSVVICHLLGLEPTPWEWERFVIGHASVSRLESLELGDGHTFSLSRLSDEQHLAAEDRTR
ncbi:MAG: histidine phosphatase family protein [Acidimicrobiia bacterium]